jgi:MFS family permease
VAGFALAALTVGWPLTAGFSGRLYMRVGFRDTALVGSTLVIVGMLTTLLLSQHSRVWQVAGACFIVGAGLGLTNSPVVVAVQSVVGWDRRGVVTGTNMFSRSLGSAVGAAVLGAVANATLANRFAHPPADLVGKLPASVDTTRLVLGGSSAEPSAVAAFIRGALFDATHNVFLVLLAVAVAGWLVLSIMPRKVVPLVFDDAAESAPSPATS